MLELTRVKSIIYSFAVNTVIIFVKSDENICIFMDAKYELKFRSFHYTRYLTTMVITIKNNKSALYWSIDLGKLLRYLGATLIAIKKGREEVRKISYNGLMHFQVAFTFALTSRNGLVTLKLLNSPPLPRHLVA